MNICQVLYLVLAVFTCVDAKLCHIPSDKVLDCSKTFEIVHKCNSDFVSHAMITSKASNPFNMCSDSDTFYSFRYTMDYYAKLFTMHESDDKSHFCSDEFLSKNRMNVISTLISNSKKLWNDAYCDNCYGDAISANYSFSFDTQRFHNFSDALEKCIDITKTKFNESVICIECQNDYQTLNTLYEEIKKSSDNKVCFDLEDKMNKTRRDWSTVYKCYKGKRDSLTAFYSLAATIFIIAISFYCAVYIIGSKYPENDTLDEREVSRNAPIEDGSRSTAASPPGPSTSAHLRPISKKKKSDKQLIINDDSDDEILTAAPIQPLNLIALSN